MRYPHQLQGKDCNQQQQQQQVCIRFLSIYSLAEQCVYSAR